MNGSLLAACGAGLVALTSGLALLGGWFMGRGSTPSLPISGQAVEGDVLPGADAISPLGDRFVFGLVSVSALTRSAGERGPAATPIVNELRGDPRVTLQTETGPVQVTLQDPMTRWIGFTATEKRMENLDSLPEVARLAQGRSFPNLIQWSVRVLAVRAGDRLLVDLAPDGTATRVWFGGRQAFLARVESHRGVVSGTSRLLMAGGGVGILMALVLGAMAWLLKIPS